jgi:2-polyprenyl-3-methyl-5-hydroxy-6-metoxy-1,4-benzoquinol methylase
MRNNENRSYIYKIKLDSKQTSDARVIASQFIEDGAKVLDVGCACGDFGVFIVDEKKCKVFGMEYDKESISEAIKTGIFHQIHQVDLNTFQTDSYPEYYGFFDYITLLDVLEHTTNPQDSFLKLRPYLKNGGGCIVSLPNVAFGDIKISLLQDDFTYTDMGIMDKTHLRFFTHKTIADFFSNINFEVVECRAKVADITKPSEDIPSRVKSFIKKDPHSYIYQYILKVRASNLSQELLMKNNNSKLNLTFSDINKELKIIQKNRLINKFLPIGSKQREVAKSLYASLKKRK